ncbi:uncharacterized protein LOC111136108 [Crassostrea virginica]
MTHWQSLMFLLISCHYVVGRDVFHSSVEMIDRGITNLTLNIWSEPRAVLTIGDCVKLCHLDPDCLSFTINLSQGHCQGHSVILEKHSPDLSGLPGAQYFYIANLPATTTPPTTTTRRKRYKG